MPEATNINDRVNNWYEKIKSNPGFSEAYTEALKNRLFHLMDELKEAELDEEEAFLIASRRIGKETEMKDKHRQENPEVIQTRRSSVILSGVMVYFLSYHLVGSLSKSFFVILLNFDLPVPGALFWMNRFLITWHFIFVVIFTSILLSEKKVMLFFENIKIRPKHTLLMLAGAVCIGIFDVWIRMTAKGYVKDLPGLRDRFLQTYIYFDFSFPILFCLGFILIYYKYYGKAKIYY